MERGCFPVPTTTSRKIGAKILNLSIAYPNYAFEMNKIPITATLVLYLLTPVGLEAAEDQWVPSTVSEKTWDQVHQAKVTYDACLTQQLATNVMKDADPRALTDAILKACEEHLNPIRTAFGNEKMPDEMIDRYLRQQRSRAAQSLVRELMGAQAVRQSQR